MLPVFFVIIKKIRGRNVILPFVSPLALIETVETRLYTNILWLPWFNY